MINHLEIIKYINNFININYIIRVIQRLIFIILYPVIKSSKYLYKKHLWLKYMELKRNFEAWSSCYDEIGITNIISWNEGMQYLDFDKLREMKKDYLNTLLTNQ